MSQVKGPRKPTARRTSESRGFLSRKLSKTQPSERAASKEEVVQKQKGSEEREHGRQREQAQDQEPPSRPTFPFKSVIPDQLAELPAWYSTDVPEWTSNSAAQFRSKYPIHNPLGPRFYRNRHLLPPSQDKRPPSFFSPSFPPMTASAERSQDSPNLPGPSRTPSGSPLPTPNSSQVRIHDIRRTRKLSQGTHDNVDMLDVTDPWGTNWHHQSPYDLGTSPVRSFTDPPEPQTPNLPPRPRRMSMTSVPRHKSVTPSPLSQSTSAVHLASEPLMMHRPRRLSKTRKSFRGLFGRDHGHMSYMSQTGSAPTTPIEFGQSLARKVSKTSSFLHASISSGSNSLAPTEKKRSSVLGRLARRFSVVKRSDTVRSNKDSIQSTRTSMQGTSSGAETPHAPERRSISPQKTPGSRAKTSDLPRRRVPLPPVDLDAPVQSKTELVYQPTDAQSIQSLDDSLPIGKLTVVNPDDPVEASHRMEYSSSGSGIEDAGINEDTRMLDEDLRSSPSPLDTPPFMHRAPLSVISEGETYLSSPRLLPAQTPQIVPMSPPTIPSVLSLPLRPAANTPPEPPAPSMSPPLPDLPPTPASKPEPPLPPTPEGTRPSSPVNLEPQHTPRMPAPIIDRLQASYLTSPFLSSIRGNPPGFVDDSPLSRASMIVNPPTPQVISTTSLPSSPPPVGPLAPIVPSPLPTSQHEHAKSTTREESPTKKDKEGTHRMRSRRTETFKLVRTSSDDVGVNGDRIVADGAHWEVVESPVEESRRKKERERTGESEKPKRRESRRLEKESASDDSDPQKKHEQRRSVHRKSVSSRYYDEVEPAAASRQSSRTLSPEPHLRSAQTERWRNPRDSQPDAVRSTQTPVIYAPNPSKQSVTNGNPVGSRMERRPSTSTRPSSELHAMADLNALKAADAWEIERLWKGRSMIYGTEGAPVSGGRHNITSDSRPTTIMSADLQRASTIPSVGDPASSVTSVPGLSHVTQSPYQSSINAMSSPQIYQPHSLYPSIVQQTQTTPTHKERSSTSRSLPESIPFPSRNTTKAASPRGNPLPEPPRFSSYQPPPLPASLAGGSDRTSSSDYWTKLAGVTVTH